MPLAGLKCSFCGLTRTGGVAGPTPTVYICGDCIDLVYEIAHHGDENVQIRFTAPGPAGPSGPDRPSGAGQ